MTRVDVHKWVTMSGGVLPQGGGIQFCRLLTLRSMYDSWHTVPDQLCSICLVVEVGATAPCVSRRIWRSHAWPRATSSPTPSPTHTSTPARRDCARRCGRHGGDPLNPQARGRRTTNDGCVVAPHVACECLRLSARTPIRGVTASYRVRPSLAGGQCRWRGTLRGLREGRFHLPGPSCR